MIPGVYETCIKCEEGAYIRLKPFCELLCPDKVWSDGKYTFFFWKELLWDDSQYIRWLSDVLRDLDRLHFRLPKDGCGYNIAFIDHSEMRLFFDGNEALPMPVEIHMVVPDDVDTK